MLDTQDGFEAAATETAETALTYVPRAPDPPKPARRADQLRRLAEQATRSMTPESPLIQDGVDRFIRDTVAQRRSHEARNELVYEARWDVRWLGKWIKRALATYEMLTSFLGFHAGGVVSRGTRRARGAYCIRCTYRVRRLSLTMPAAPVDDGEPLDRRDRCSGWLLSGSCNCPDDPIWRPASIGWQLWLRWFRCPLGHWDRGNSCPPPMTARPGLRPSTGCGGCGK